MNWHQMVTDIIARLLNLLPPRPYRRVTAVRCVFCRRWFDPWQRRLYIVTCPYCSVNTEALGLGPFRFDPRHGETFRQYLPEEGLG